MIAIAVAAGWVAGLLLAADGVAVIWTAVPPVLAAPLALRWRAATLWRYLLLGLLAVPLAGLRFTGYSTQLHDADLAGFVLRSTVRTRGTVLDSPIPYGSGVGFPFAVAERERGDAWWPTEGTVLVITGGSVPYAPGDQLEVAGVLLPPDPLLPPYQSPTYQEGILAVVNRPQITPLPGGGAPSLVVRLARVRADAARVLDRALPEPAAGLGRGITLGERRTLGPELTDDFNRTNTSHILAVDGYKVGLVSTFLERSLMLVFPRLVSVLGTIGGIALYTVFVGGSPSALRAAIMGGIYTFGRFLGRPRDTLNALAIAALLITLWRPFLLWNLAFQLSFVTTVGMTALAPLTEAWIPHRLGVLREAVGTTIAAEIASAPLVIVAFDHLSLASLPVHAVVMPMLPLAIGLSVLTTLAGLVFPPAAAPLGLLAWVPLSGIVTVVAFAGRLPLAALPLPPLGLGAVLGFYAALGLGILARPNPFFGRAIPFVAFWRALTARVPARVLVPGVAVPAILLGALLVPRAPSVDRIRFLNLPGDAALLQTAAGQRVYLHGNASSSTAARALDPTFPLNDRSLDVAVLTAADDQALTDLGQLADRITFRQVVRPADGFSALADDRWREISQSHGIPTAEVDLGAVPGPRVDLGNGRELVVYPLAPFARSARAKPGEGTLAIRATLGRGTVLWVSAVPEDQARLLGRNVPLSAAVLKLSGRASRWGLDREFFARVNPSVVILPSAVSDRFANATPGTLDLLNNRQVYRTDLDGEVVVTFGEEGMEIETVQQ
ncbi:MAG TPA: ComEC/Rec2 family competence protein [Chloroflexota bacterium]|nr:ComEC/Rec2 family competence protein [Chloroflexota bacterium]